MKAKAFIISMRPGQWIKNLFIFAALVFSQKFLDTDLLFKTIIAFVDFCLISGAVYIINDVFDIKIDRMHPKKSKRPIPNNEISKKQAISFFVILTVFAFGLAFFLDKSFFLMALIYFLVNIMYSMKLKHMVIIDVFLVAAGFLIRVIAGGLLIDVPISSWLLICTLLLSLFIAMGKRRHELLILDQNAYKHRPILKEYSTYLLDQMIAVVTASTLIAYCLYTISEETIKKFDTPYLFFTSPLVLYGIFRYLYLIHRKEQGGSPGDLIIKDKPLLIDIILWILSVVFIIYVL
ncbi:MAG: decaprenyl-phosphate phosphoribosyltransferase [Candidatus Aminicenantaceae bacterium]